MKTLLVGLMSNTIVILVTVTKAVNEPIHEVQAVFYPLCNTVETNKAYSPNKHSEISKLILRFSVDHEDTTVECYLENFTI